MNPAKTNDYAQTPVLEMINIDEFRDINSEENKYDVGIFNLWPFKNYGGVLNAYALQTVVEKLGYASILINWQYPLWRKAYPGSFVEEFANKHLKITRPYYTYTELREVNSQIHTFIAGSDCIWAATWFTDSLNFLDFTLPEKRRISYAPSFANADYNPPPDLMLSNKYYLDKFDSISVREYSGQQIIKNIFKKEAQVVLDPTLLLDITIYEALIEQTDKETAPYILRYTIDEALKSDENIDTWLDHYPSETIFSYNQFGEEKISISRWLSLIKNARILITNSYHACCFAIIFEIPFWVTQPAATDFSRFDTLLETLRLSHRIIKDTSSLEKIDLFESIDWKNVHAILAREKERSINWLKAALEKPKDLAAITPTDAIIAQLKSRITNLEDSLSNKLDEITGTIMNTKENALAKSEFQNVVEFRSNYFKYLKYKVLKNFVFSGTKERYKKKQAIFHEKVREARRVLKSLQNTQTQENCVAPVPVPPPAPAPAANFTTAHYILAMLKAYGIRHIVTSPGTQCAAFNLLAQQDNFFIMRSVVDEKSAAYVASGIINETRQPVVITCTGATASRNYMSALTEAYYRKLPIIALTFFNYDNNPYIISPQFIDRRVSPNDIKTIDVELPKIYDAQDKSRCLTFLNVALATAKYKQETVHINCPSFINFGALNGIKGLPADIWHTQCFFDKFDHLKKELQSRKIGIFIGAHAPFSPEAEKAISNFAKNYHAAVFCDHTSHYNGENKVLITQAVVLSHFSEKPDIVIDIGEICGDYTHYAILFGREIWRINEDLRYRNRAGYPVKYAFMCPEQRFFEAMNHSRTNTPPYFENVKKQIRTELPQEMPLCAYLVAYNLSKHIPKNASLHVSILNSLRAVDYFEFDKTIEINCNVGAFGIDGAVSSLVGQSFADQNKKCFGLIGDLAFFYDMNILGNRDIRKNLRILMVNNNRGYEFSMPMFSAIQDRVSEHVAAAGHYKNGAKGWVTDCGFEYLRAETKEEFLSQIHDFCNKDYDKPVFFEIITTNTDEIKGYNLMGAIKDKK